ncbi:MAG: DEAD/DEAH box helicase [Acidimicrobiales bacterium]|nr:DEAD/DEAH box helicase [Acidimicrobiales bacterium]
MSDRDSASPAGPTFADLDLRPELLTTLAELGYDQPTPIQAEAIPHLLAGHDLLGQAATGTGKTAAFALPVIDSILEGIEGERPADPVALVLVPTRELAIQVSDALTQYGAQQMRQVVRVVPVYGGQPIHRQFQQLKRGVHVVVATPGRAIDHLKRGSLRLDSIRTVVLDEADEMLDMGFTEDIETILGATPTDRQTVLFSATMPPRITSIAKRHQREPVRVTIKRDASDDPKSLIRQTVYFVDRRHKSAALGRIIDVEAPTSALVFCATRHEVDALTVTMNGRGYRTEALHGGMDQAQRDRVMGRLRDGTAEILIATDVAARGLDVDSLTHVVNYDVPTAPESYVHRIGRVGRAGREGTAITLAEPRQRRLLSNIERLTKVKLTEASLPTVADMHARQIGLTADAVRAAMADDDLDDYDTVLHELAGGGNDRQIALAAIKLLHTARGGGNDEVEIPAPTSKKGRHRDTASQSGAGKNEAKRNGGSKNGHGRNGTEKRGNRGRPTPGGGRVYINLGRKAGVRPGDLVGAIANETGLTGAEIGPIRVNDTFSVVGVPEDSVDLVVSAISASSIRGKKARSRRYVD